MKTRYEGADARPKERRTPTLSVSDLSVDMLQIFSTQSASGDCGTMMDVIVAQIQKICADTVVLERDTYGNLYVTKGESDTYPIFVSHTDTVHKVFPSVAVVRSAEGNYFAYTEDGASFQQIGIGGDDKCGIIVCIEMLARLNICKAAFFLDEEVGCKGSNAGSLEFFRDGLYAIQVDRRDNCDIITSGAGEELCSTEFKTLLAELGKEYGYAPTTGLSTDVVALKRRGMNISAVNLSAGYYNPHTKQEYVNETDLLNCLEFCLKIANDVTEVYPHEKKQYTPPPRIHGGYQSGNVVGNVNSGNRVTKSLAPPSQYRCMDCSRVMTLEELEEDCYLCTKCGAKALADAVLPLGEQKYLVRQGARTYLISDTPPVRETSPSLAIDACDACGGSLMKEEYESGFCTPCSVNMTGNKCRVCALALQNPQEMQLGVCLQCQHCPNCKSELTLQEMLAEDCGRCDAEALMCGMCASTLESESEKLDGLCKDCCERFTLSAGMH